MTPEETQMLNDLADKIAKTPSPAHDAEAEQFIRTRIGSRPDALYIMTQTVLIQNLALEHAKQQIQELQQRAAQNPAPQSGGTLLPGGRPASGYSAPPPPPPSYAPPPAYSQAPPASAPGPGGISSFLHSAATTAAGVAAGALAFEGIRSLFGGHLGGFGGGFGGGVPSGSSFLGGAPPETIINNYYDSPEGSSRDEVADDDSLTGEASAQDQDDTDDSAQSGDDSDYTETGDDGGGMDSGGDDSGGGGDWV